MITRKLLLVNIVGIFIAAGILGLAQNVYAGGPPPLTKQEINGVLKCQEGIKEEGFEFVKAKLKGLEKCIDKVLEIQLPWENGVITQEEFDAALAKVREKCQEFFNEIDKASTTLIDKIVKKCGPVADIVLDPARDPLGFAGGVDENLIVIPCGVTVAGSETDGIGFETVEDLAGVICCQKEFLVDEIVHYQVPRLSELLNILWLYPTLDSRCQQPLFDNNGTR